MPDFKNTENMRYTDPSQNFMMRYPQPLDAIFLPKTIAVIGAKDTIGSVGRTIMLNLLAESFQGKVFPVNPKRDYVFNLKAYPHVSAIPELIDLAVIVTPAKTVPGIISECASAGVKACIIISAGFKELGESGLQLEEEILHHAKKSSMRIIGPNCLGVMNPIYGMNATFAKGMALPGNIAFISQSGAMCTAVLDWSFKERVGFSSFVSIGSMVDVNWGDLIDYLGQDPHTRSILIYMETIGNPRSFLSAAREIALEKPIIVIKPGKSQEAAKAAASHTGSLAGSDEVFEAALERVGVLRVNTISELFNMAAVLARQPKPKGPNLCIVTNAGGPSVLATDATVLEGASIATLENHTIEKLNQFLPEAWSHSNPIDILGDATPERYAKTIESIADDSNSDGILIILSPQDMTDPIETAECLRPYAHTKDKPILASWMGGDFVSKGIEILNRAKIPTFEYPDDAAWSFATMWKHTENLLSLHETPFISQTDEIQLKKAPFIEADKLIQKVKSESREILTEFESKKLLSLYGIPIVETLIAQTSQEAIQHAKNLGYPIVLKLHSEKITHKSDVGGVKLNLEDENAVLSAFSEIQESVKKKFGAEAFQGVTVQRMVKKEGYELILGSSIDSQFGPVLLFGAGGILVEIFKDNALGFPPLNMTLARRLMKKTKIYEALQGVRGKKAINLPLLESILMRFSQMIVENRWIKECDINPLMASPEEIVALDARIILYPSTMKETEIFPLAIRPYPTQYMTTANLVNGMEMMLRPIRPEDESLMTEFHKELSEKSIRQRYFEFVSLNERVAHERLVRICFNDFDREIAIVAEGKHPETGKKFILGIARLSRIPGTQIANLTMIIRDAFHGMGLGTLFMQNLIHIAREEQMKMITAKILSENHGMIHICQKFGFQTREDSNKKFILAELKFEK